MTQKLNVIFDNAADRATSIAASTTSGTLVASNMQNDFKGQTHRSTGTSVTYTLTWTAGESVGGLGMPATNLTAAATVRMRLYSDTACTALIADSGTVYACPGLNLGLWNWANPINANAFAYGGVSKVGVWLDQMYFAKGCIIDLVDSGNAAGYIDNARLVVGAYWTPTQNANYGLQVAVNDTTKNSRNDAGDNPSDRGVVYDTMTLELKYMQEVDRQQLMYLIRNAGSARNMFFSILPGNSSSVAEQDAMIYGKRKNAPVSFDAFAIFSSKLDMEGW